jgi:hypothetical protein
MEKLLEQVKRKLNITWDDDETTARLEDIINSAIPDLKHKLGIADDENFDFSEAGPENTLFLAYCLYEWNHSLEEFDVNYSRMIAQIQTKREVVSYLDGVIADEV